MSPGKNTHTIIANLWTNLSFNPTTYPRSSYWADPPVSQTSCRQSSVQSIKTINILQPPPATAATAACDNHPKGKGHFKQRLLRSMCKKTQLRPSLMHRPGSGEVCSPVPCSQTLSPKVGLSRSLTKGATTGRKGSVREGIGSEKKKHTTHRLGHLPPRNVDEERDPRCKQGPRWNTNKKKRGKVRPHRAGSPQPPPETDQIF